MPTLAMKWFPTWGIPREGRGAAQVMTNIPDYMQDKGNDLACAWSSEGGGAQQQLGTTGK